MKRLPYIILILALVSCNSTTTTETTPSSETTLTSLTFKANDSIPGLAAASFTIEEPADTGRVYNIDSLAFGTRIDSVIPYFSFKATPAAATLYTGNDTIELTGLDTVDFTVQPVKLFVVAADLAHTRWYNIYVNVHKVDPDLYTWETLCSRISSAASASQKALYFNDNFLFLSCDGLEATAFTSQDAETWQQQPTDFPINASVKKILKTDDYLLLADNENIWLSDDGLQWDKYDCSSFAFSFENMLFTLDDSVWAIVKDKTDNSLRLATSADALNWNCHAEALPANFPVADYTTEVFSSPSWRDRAIVLGGYDAQGNMLNTTWNMELYADGKSRWTEYSFSEPDFMPIASAQIISYNERLFLFGGIGAEGKLKGYIIKESTDEGLTWHDVDSAKNTLPETYTSRYGQSVFVYDKNIYVIGGQSLTEVFSDVYRGRLGSIDFLKK